MPLNPGTIETARLRLPAGGVRSDPPDVKSVPRRERLRLCQRAKNFTGIAVPDYSAAAGNAFTHSAGSSSSGRFGKNRAHARVTTENADSTIVTAATLPVRS
jgi:hypothetical protein